MSTIVTDWEDKYRRLYEKNKELQLKCNEKDETIKKLQTKIRKLETDFSALERLKAGEVIPRAPKLSREDEELVPSLYEQINKLKGQNAALVEKNKEIQDILEKKKRELAISKKVLQSKKPPSVPTYPLNRATSPSATEIEIRAGPTKLQPNMTPQPSLPILPDQNTPINNIQPDPHLLEIAKKYKERLAVAEEQLNKLREENLRLQQNQSNVVNHKSDSLSDAETKLRDTTWRLQQLQTQYDYLVSKSSAMTASVKNYEDQLDDYSKKVKDLRRALEDLRYEKEMSDAKADRVAELQDQVVELRQTNRNLEDKIARLCETPYINESFRYNESQIQFENMKKEREQLIAKVEHLQEAVRTNFSALTTLKHEIVEVRQENEDMNKKNEELRLRYSELENDSNVLENKLKLYSGDDGIDLESLERALTLVKRKSDAPQRLPFLESVNDDSDILSLAGVKRKLEEVQLVNIKLSEESEKLENMLKLQTNINRDLHSELEMIAQQRTIDVQDLRQTVADLEDLNRKRLNKIQALEAQLRQHVYKSTEYKSKRLITKDKTDLANIDSAEILLNDFLEETKGEGIADQNLLQIWCKSGEFFEGIIRPGCSSFIVVDFFDFESQTTTLQVGSKPHWDCGITFKVAVDDFLIRYLASDVAVLEVNMVVGGDYTLLSRVTIPLHGLLRAKPAVQLVNHPMLSVDTGELIGHLNIDMRLALPLSELYRLYLERHPSEKRMIEDISTRRLIQSSNALEQATLIKDVKNRSLHHSTDPAEESRLYNEIEVSILNAKDLNLGSIGKPPTSYVLIQILSFPDKFTNPVPNTTNPIYNEKFTYPMFSNESSLRLLRTSRLLISVLDMNAEDSNYKDDGLIGEAAISLSDLALGHDIKSFFKLKGPGDKRVGEIEIEIRWKYVFKQPREVGPRALSNNEVEILLSIFTGSNYSVNDGIVDYRMFCRYINPPRDIASTIKKLRNYAINLIEKRKLSDQYHSSARDIYRVILSKSPVTFDAASDPDDKATSSVDQYDKEYFTEKLRSIQLDILPSSYHDLYDYIDTDKKGVITINQFITMLELDDINNIPPSLQMKLRDRAAELHAKNINPLQIFDGAVESFGGPSDGLISRLEFKACLHKIGFTLIDEPDTLHLLTAPKKKIGPGRSIENIKESEEQKDILNDSAGSDGVLMPMNESYDDHRKYNDEQRKTFEERRLALESRAREIVQERKMTKENQEEEMNLDTNIVTHIGKNVLNNKTNFGRERLNRTKRENHDEIIDPVKLNRMATRIQSRYRGHLVRKNFDLSSISSSLPLPKQANATPTNKSDKSAFNLKSNAKPSQSSPLDTVTNILEAELTIRECMKGLQGVQSPPNLLGGFMTVDRKRTGFVNRAQFAHVLKQYPMIRLYGAELKSCMDFFDIKADGAHISYSAFSDFVLYQQSEYPPAIDKLNNYIALTSQQIGVLTRLDKNGQGYLPRNVMIRYFHEIGYGYLSQSIITAIIELFEINEIGLMNYLNFAEFVIDNTASHNYRNLERTLFDLFESKGDVDDDRVLRHWFKLIMKNAASANKGMFNVSDLYQFTKDFSIVTTQQATSTLFSIIDKENAGEVSLSDFSLWIRKYKTTISDGNYNYRKNFDILFTDLKFHEIQIKIQKFLLLLANTVEGSDMMTLSDVSKSFEIYDIPGKLSPQQSGCIPSDCFLHAILRCGFALTSNEQRLIIQEFQTKYKPGYVNYQKFLEWGTDVRVQGNIETRTSNAMIQYQRDKSNDKSKRSIGPLIKYLETAIQRGIDLLSIFGKYDRESIGRITSNDFCAAISDLGLSSVTQEEAMQLADRFKAGVGEYILYRHIVSELLHFIDESVGSDSVDIIDVIRSAMIQSNVELSRLRSIFEHYDAKKNGKVLEKDVPFIFEDARIPLKSRDIDVLCDIYSVGGKSGYISYSGLLSGLEYRIVPKLSSSMNPRGGISNSRIPDDLLDKLNKLFESLILRGKDFRAEFDRCDDTFLGSITKANFRDIIQDIFKANLYISEIEFLEQKYVDPKDSRRFLHVQFLFDFHPRQASILSTDETSSNRMNDDDSDREQRRIVNNFIENLRNKIRRRCDFYNPMELKRPFHHFARRKSHPNIVLYSDFSIAIRELGIKLPADQELAVFQALCVIHRKISDANVLIPETEREAIIRSSTQELCFNFLDFNVFVNDPYHNDVMWKFKRSLMRSKVSSRELIDSLYQYLEKNSNLSYRRDGDREECITLKGFEKVLKSCDIVDMSDSDIQRFVLHFDPDGKQQLNISLFVQFLRFEYQDVTSTSQVPSSGKATNRDSSNFNRNSSVNDDETESLSWKQLKSNVQAKIDEGYTTNEVFILFDMERQGLVDLTSLQLGCRELGINLTRSEARAMLRRMNFMIEGPVDKESFFRVLRIDTSNNSNRESGFSSRHRDEEPDGYQRMDGRSRNMQASNADYDRVIGNIRDRCNELVSMGEFHSGVTVLRDAFKLMNTNNSNRDNPESDSTSCTQKELNHALKDAGIRVTRSDISRIFEILDPNMLGYIGIETFIRQVFPPIKELSSSSDKTRNVTRDVEIMKGALRKRVDLEELLKSQFKTVYEKHGKMLMDLKTLFIAKDVYNRGKLERNAFLQCLMKFGIAITSSYIQRDLADSLAEDFEQGEIDYNVFLIVINDLLGSIYNQDDGLIKVLDDNNRTKKNLTVRYDDLIDGGRDRKTFNGILDRVIDKLGVEYGSAVRVSNTLDDIFSNYSNNSRDSSISSRNFRNAMQDLRLQLSEDEMDIILENLRRSNDGMIDYKEFINLVTRGPQKSAMKDAAPRRSEYKD